MSQAAAATPDPGPRTLEEWVALQCDLLARNLAETERVERLVAAAMTQQDCLELVMVLRRQADLEGAMMAVGGHIAQAAVVRTLGQIYEEARRAELAAVPEPEPAPRHRHRAPRKRPEGVRPLYPRSLPAWVPAPVAAAGTALRHSWAGTHAAAATATAAAAGTAATLVIGTAVLTGTPAHGAAHHLAGGGAVAGISVSAVPIPSSSPLPPFARGAAKPKLDADASGPGPFVLSPLPPVYVPPPADPSPQGSQSAGQPAGTLTADVTQLSLGGDGVTYSGQVTITASGGDVAWGIVPSSRDVTVSTPDGTLQGTLAAGSTLTLTVSVSAAAQQSAGSAVVRILPGVQVDVTWIALPPAPAVSPSAVPSAVSSLLNSQP